MSPTTFDIVILGGGPAGAIAAGQLASEGLSVLLAESGAIPSHKPGSLLPIAAARVLDQCGIWEKFQSQGHPLVAGNRMAWGNRSIGNTRSKINLDQQAFQLDRKKFEILLLEYAQSQGASVWMGAHFELCSFAENQWQITLKREGNLQTLHARYLVDATGSQRAVQTHLGIPFQTDDVQQCLMLTYQAREENALPTHPCWIESVAEGWWNASPLSDREWQLMFFTQPFPADKFPRDLQKLWEKHLKSTHQILPLLTKNRFTPTGTLDCRLVESGRSQTIAGEHWCAIGDAAITFDPLSYQGLISAMYGGIRIKEPILKWLSGNHQPMQDYVENQLAIYHSYLANHTQLYLEEKRWPNHPFWRQRQSRQ